MSNILIVYFSGTYGTEKVVNELEKSLIKNGETVTVFPLDLSKVKSLDEANDKLNNIDRLVVAYPVYAFDAPAPVFKWIKLLPEVKDLKTSVLSISAGGDVSGNKTSRKRSINKLEKKGFIVDYEKMITMPSNYAATASDEINILLVKAAPIIAKKIANDIVNNVVTREEVPNSITAPLAASLFKIGGIRFGKTLKLNENCTNCKWCENNCPTGNIKIENGKIKSGNQCTWCMRCVYGCPTKAIESRILGFSILKDGFSIKKMEEKSKEVDIESIKNIEKQKGWEGAVEYLNEVYNEK